MTFIHENRKCRNCGKVFLAKRDHHHACSAECRLDYWRKKNSDPQKISEIEHRLQVVEKKLGI